MGVAHGNTSVHGLNKAVVKRDWDPGSYFRENFSQFICIESSLDLIQYNVPLGSRLRVGHSMADVVLLEQFSVGSGSV